MIDALWQDPLWITLYCITIACFLFEAAWCLYMAYDARSIGMAILAVVWYGLLIAVMTLAPQAAGYVLTQCGG